MNHGPNYIKVAAHLEMSIHVDPDNQWVLLAEGTLAAEVAEAVGGKEYHAWQTRGGSTSIACRRWHFDRMPPLAEGTLAAEDRLRQWAEKSTTRGERVAGALRSHAAACVAAVLPGRHPGLHY